MRSRQVTRMVEKLGEIVHLILKKGSQTAKVSSISSPVVPEADGYRACAFSTEASQRWADARLSSASSAHARSRRIEGVNATVQPRGTYTIGHV